MDDPTKTAQTSATRARVSLALQLVGVSDIVLGIAIAVGGPIYFGRDPTLDLILPILGGLMALAGAGICWYARSVYGRRD